MTERLIWKLFEVCEPPRLIEAIVEAQREYGHHDLFLKAGKLAKTSLRARRGYVGNESQERLLTTLCELLLHPSSEDMFHLDERALHLFIHTGALKAAGEARETLSFLKDELSKLDPTSTPKSPNKNQEEWKNTWFLYQIKSILLDRNTLIDLTKIGLKGEKLWQEKRKNQIVKSGIVNWILDTESCRPSFAAELQGKENRLRRLEILKGLANRETEDGFKDGLATREETYALWVRAVRKIYSLIPHLSPELRKCGIETLARTFDILVKINEEEVPPLFLNIILLFPQTSDLRLFADFLLSGDLENALLCYASFSDLISQKESSSSFESYGPGERQNFSPSNSLTLKTLAHALPFEKFSEKFDICGLLKRINRLLFAIGESMSLRELVAKRATLPSLVEELESAIYSLVQVGLEVTAKFDSSVEIPILLPTAPLSSLLSEIIHSGQPGALRTATLNAAMEPLSRFFPAAIFRFVMDQLSVICTFSIENKRESLGPPSTLAELPIWLSAQRTLGDFYVLKALGEENEGSTFVATRHEDRQKYEPECFVLEVPIYSRTAAKNFSSTAFLNLFCDEAATLLKLPHHKNLVKFMAFDKQSRPKPVLVMEFIEGITLEKLLQTRQLSMPVALTILEGLLDALSVMHSHHMAHLDIKPSNVVLRKSSGDAVLVDVGLAGRHMRPGYQTWAYGAPEVWGATDASSSSFPISVDIYVMGCLIYEVLTSKKLFEAKTDYSAAAHHLSHDGLPPQLKPWTANTMPSPLQNLAALLQKALRKAPRQRIQIEEFRNDFRKLLLWLHDFVWPLQ